MKITSKSITCLILAIVLVLSLSVFSLPTLAVSQLDTAQGDVNNDGYVTEEDLTLLDNILQGLAPSTTYADVDGNNIVDQLDKTVLQNLLGALAPITDPNDLLDNVSQVTLEGNTGSASAQLQSTVAKGDSTVALKFWSQAANGNPIAELSLAAPLDLSEVEAICMDLLFVNSDDKQIQVSLLTGTELTQSDIVSVLVTSDKVGWSEGVVMLNQFGAANLMDIRAIQFHYNSAVQTQAHTVYVDNLRASKLALGEVGDQLESGFYITLAPSGQKGIVSADQSWPILTGTYQENIKINGQAIELPIQYTGIANRLFVAYNDELISIMEAAKALNVSLYLEIPAGSTFVLGGDNWVATEDWVICNSFTENGAMSWKVCDHENHTEEVPTVAGISVNYIQTYTDSALRLVMNPRNVNAITGITGWGVMGGNYDTTVTLNGQDVSVTIKWPDQANHIWIDFGADILSIIADAKELKAPLYLTFPKGTTLELDGSTWTFFDDQIICNVFNEDGTMGWKVCDHESHTEPVPQVKGIRLNYIHEQYEASMKLHLVTVNESAVSGTTMGWPAMGGNYDTTVTLNGQDVSVTIKWPDAENFIWIDFGADMQSIIAEAKELKAPLYLTFPQGTALELDGYTWTFYEDQRICNVFNEDGTMTWKVCDHESHTEPVPQVKGIRLNYIHEQYEASMKLHLVTVNESAVSGTTIGWPVMGGNYDTTVTLNGQDVSVTIKWPDAENFIWIDFGADMQSIIAEAKEQQATLYLTIPQGTTIELDGYTWTFYEDQRICNVFNEDGTMTWKVCDHESHTEPVPQKKGIELNYIHEQNAARTGMKLHLNTLNENSVSGTSTWTEMGGNWSSMVTLNGQSTSLCIKWTDVENFIYIDLYDTATVNAAMTNMTSLVLTIPEGTTLELDGYTWTFYKEQSLCNAFDDAGNMSWQVCTHDVHVEQTEINVVDNSSSTYSIVVPENATACEEFAASELQSFLYQTTGATLEIKKDTDEAVGARVLSVGNTSFLNNSGLVLADGTTKDKYAITNTGYTIYLYGNTDRAVLYSVYEFLESYTGLRFVSADYTYVPQCTTVTIEKNLHKEYDSVVDLRMYWTCDSMYDALYAARKRFVTTWNGSEPKYGEGLYRDYESRGHNTRSLIQAGLDSYGLTEIPDYVYATDLDGNRLSEQIGSDNVWDICWSNGIADDGTFIEEVSVDVNGNAQPTVAQLLLAGLKAQLDYNKTATIFNVIQEDSQTVICNCMQCNQHTQNYGACSANIVRMLNALAIELNEYTHSSSGDGRDIKLLTNAYVYSQEAPVLGEEGNYYVYDNSVIPNEHTLIQYATMNYTNHAFGVADEAQSDEHKDCMNKWEWLCSTNQNLLLYTYSTNFNCSFTYNPNLDGLLDTFYYSIENLSDTLLVFEGDAYSDDWQQSLRAYIMSELFWDPDAEVQALLQEFVTLYYGRSAPVVQAYIDRMEALADYNRATYGNNYFLMVADHTSYNIHNAKYWSLEQLELSIQELKAELDAIAADETLSQAEKDRLICEVEQVLIAPMMQIKYNYFIYYLTTSGREAFVEELCQLVEKHPEIYHQAAAWELLPVEVKGIDLNYIHEQSDTSLKVHLNTVNENAVSGTTTGWPVMGGNYDTTVTLNGQDVSVTIKWPEAENFIWIDFGADMQSIIADAKELQAPLYLTFPRGTTLALDGYTWTFYQDQRICNVFNEDGTMTWKVCDHESHTESVPQIKGIGLNYIHEQSEASMKLHMNAVNENAISGTTGWGVMGGNYNTMVTLNGQNVSVTIKWPDAENFIWIDFGADMLNIIADAKELQAPLYLTFPKGTTLALDGYTWTFLEDQRICNVFNADGTMTWKVCDHESHTESVPQIKGIQLHYIHEQNDAKTGMKLHLTAVNENAVSGTTTGWPVMGGNWSSMITLNGQSTSLSIKWTDAENFIYIDLFDTATVNNAMTNKTSLVLTIPQGTTLELDGYTWTFYKEQTICNSFDDAGNMSWIVAN